MSVKLGIKLGTSKPCNIYPLDAEPLEDVPPTLLCPPVRDRSMVLLSQRDPEMVADARKLSHIA